MVLALKERIKFVREVDSQAAEVYSDRLEFSLPFTEIAHYRGIPLGGAIALYIQAKTILKDPQKAWLYGLSARAKHAILLAGYTNFLHLYTDVVTAGVDLEAHTLIGHKVACEIGRWCRKRRRCN